MKLQIPATAYIGCFETLNTKDRLIYTDPATAKIIVKKISITSQELRKFIDEHMTIDTARAT